MAPTIKTNVVLDQECRDILDRAPRGFSFSAWCREKIKTELKEELGMG